MMKSVAVSLSILLSLILNTQALSWDDKVTHKDLSQFAAEYSVLNKTKGNYLKNIGFEQGVKESLRWEATISILDWLRAGAELEDAGSRTQAVMGKARFNNHFHNPLKPWSEAGLDDWIGPLHYTGESSLLWAQDGGAQLSIVEGVWTWQMTRHYFYLALTAMLDSARQENFAKTFKGLGHQMHLLQDAAVPDHVRNDAHPEDALLGKKILNGSAFFETWAKNERQRIIDLATNPVFPNVSFNISYNGLAPVTQLFDAELYDGLNASAGINQGLSEYTNANFISGDTVFAAERYTPSNRHYFPYPKKSSTDLQSYITGTKPLEIFDDFDGSSESGIWVSKLSDGETVSHFLKAGLFTRALYNLSGETEDFYKSFYRDEKCHEDYASKLIPRAVGYSAALLDYFFRGTLEISAPATYVYAITDGSVTPQKFTKIKAKVKNTTLNEVMTNGILQAVAKYKVIPNYDPTLANYPPNGTAMKDTPYSYSVSSPLTLMPEQLGSMNMYPTEFTFDFTQNPIPAGITDLYLQIIFKGTLGNEKDTAVAVGRKDLMEPAHHIFWNLSDMFSLDGHLYTAQQIRANPELLERASGQYIDPYPMNFEISYMPEAPPANPPVVSARVDSLPEGRYIRLITLVDDELTDNYLRLVYSDNIDITAETVDFAFEGVVNQETEGVWQPPTPAVDFRRTKGHIYTGILRCKPMSIDPVTGYSYCPYPESEAYSADLTAYPAVISFP